MLISRELADAFNSQIGNELGASLQYISIAAHFRQRHLTLLAKLFMEQSDEERQHAQKFIDYLLDTKADLGIPAIAAPKPTFAFSRRGGGAPPSQWENDVTAQVTRLMDRAVKEERLPRAELPAVVHRRAARGGREDGPPARRHPSVGRKKPVDGRGLPGAHRKGRIARPSSYRRTVKSIASWR